MNKAVRHVSSNHAPVTINSYQQQPQEQIQQKFLLLKETAVKYSNKRCNCKCSKTTAKTTAATTTDTSTKIMQNSESQLLEKQTQQQVGDLYQQQQQQYKQKSKHFNDLNKRNFKISIDCCRRKKYPSTETIKSAVAPTVTAAAAADQSTIDQLLSSAGNCVCFGNARNSSKDCCSSTYYNTPSCSPINVPNTTSKTSQPKVLSKANKDVIFCDIGESYSSELDKDALYLLAATKTSSSQVLSQQRQRKLQKVVVCNSNNFLKVCLFLLLLLLLLSKAILFLATAIAFSCTSLLLLKQRHQSMQCARRNALCSFLLSSLLYAQLLSLTPQTLGSNGDSNVINTSNVSTTNSSKSVGSSSALLGLEITFGNAAAIVPHDDDEQQQKKLTSLHDVTQLMVTLDSSSSSSNNLVNAKAKHAPDALLAGGGSNIVKFISRDHVLERAHIGTESVPVTENVAPQLHNSGCHSCQVREKAKQDNLESIKNHILMRLQLTKPPNITAPIKVPYNIIEDFYKNFGANGGGPTVKKESSKTVAYARHYHASYSDSSGSSSSSSSSGADAADMQGDDPFSYSTAAAASTAQRQQFLHSYGSEMDDGWQPQLLGEMDDADGKGGSSRASEKSAKAQQWNFDEALEVDEPEDDDFEDEFYSRVNSVYVFPTTSRLRHNRKLEILNFQLDDDQTQSATISHAFVHVYIRGHDWMRKHLLDPPVFQSFSTENYGGVDVNNDEVVITIHQAVRRQNATNFTHTIKLSETRHKIPNGTGQWVRIELKQLASFWTNSRNSTQGIVVKGAEPWMRTYIVAGSSASSDFVQQNKTNHVFIELLTKQTRKGRYKRSTSLDCSESDNEVRCCRYPLRVNFSNFGWNWVVAPTSFNAYFCNGECKLGFLEKHAHTHLASLSTSAQPCCSPTKMSPLKLLYFNNDNSLVLSTIPNMSVEKCSCS